MMGKKPLPVGIALVLVFAYLLAACGQPDRASLATDLESRIERVEQGLVPLGPDGQPRWDDPQPLEDRLAHHGVPGLSVAVIDDYQIVWARGYGTLRAGGDEPVTPDILFHAGSVAKPVSAMGVLTLVDQGLLDLDGKVNDKLISWHIPENDYTAQEKVTLRRLMSHSAGIVDGWSGAMDECCYATAGHAPTLTLQQMLEAAPATGLPTTTRVRMLPGEQYRYANLGFGLLELLVADVTGQPFVAFMQ
jgi:CubicO group peptidase (beta-lactamase class C family)